MFPDFLQPSPILAFNWLRERQSKLIFNRLKVNSLTFNFKLTQLI